MEQPWESQSPGGHRKVRTGVGGEEEGREGPPLPEEGREGPPLPSPSALWKHVAFFFLILEKSSRPTFNHIPEYTSEDHILKPESASQERKEGEAGRRQGAPGAIMCLKRKTSIGYMGRLHAWESTLPGQLLCLWEDTTNAAHTGGFACLCTHAFRTIACLLWKAHMQMGAPGSHTFMNTEMGWYGACVFTWAGQTDVFGHNSARP